MCEVPDNAEDEDELEPVNVTVDFLLRVIREENKEKMHARYEKALYVCTTLIEEKFQRQLEYKSNGSKIVDGLQFTPLLSLS